jgi:flagellar hook assembly protein FlgD
MKTKFFLSMLLATFLFGQMAFATAPNVEDEDAITKVEVKGSANSKLLIVDLSNLQNDNVSVSIFDEEQHVLYSETTSDVKNFTKKFNLWKLEVGTYTLKVVQNKFRTIQPFEVTAKNVVVNENTKKVNFEPMFKFKENKLEVLVPLSENEVFITILDSTGNVVFEEKNENVQSFRKKYDLKNLPKGEYLVEVTIEGESFYHNIKQ